MGILTDAFLSPTTNISNQLTKSYSNQYSYASTYSPVTTSTRNESVSFVLNSPYANASATGQPAVAVTPTNSTTPALGTQQTATPTATQSPASSSNLMNYLLVGGIALGAFFILKEIY